MTDIEALAARLEAVESDGIGQGLSNNRYRNPDGPEAAAKLRELSDENALLREALSGTHWTIAHQSVAKAIVDAVRFCGLGPSDDEDMLQIYDIIPEEWCAPDRIAATELISEAIAFAVLDAWLFQARAALGGSHER